MNDSPAMSIAPAVMVGEGRPSTSFLITAPRRDVDGRPSPTMTTVAVCGERTSVFSPPGIRPLFVRRCTRGASRRTGVQLSRVSILISGRAGALPPDKAAVGCTRNAARTSAADHPAGPHGCARMVCRAVIMVLNASAPAPRRMISLRAWLTTRPGRPISRKRNAFIRFVAQSLPSTSRFIAVFRLCARIIRAHHAALAPN